MKKLLGILVLGLLLSSNAYAKKDIILECSQTYDRKEYPLEFPTKLIANRSIIIEINLKEKKIWFDEYFVFKEIRFSDREFIGSYNANGTNWIIKIDRVTGVANITEMMITHPSIAKYDCEKAEKKF